MSRDGMFTTLRRWVWSVEDRMDLRRQLTLATSVLCFATVAILAIGAASVGRDGAMRSATDTLNEIAVTVADRMSRGIATRVDMLEHLASLERMTTVWRGSPDVARRVLARARETLDGTQWIGFASPEGIVTVATGGEMEGVSMSRHAWFKSGATASAVIDSGTAVQLGAEADNSPNPSIIQVGVPVTRADNSLIGVLGLYLSRSWAERLRSSTAGAADGSGGIEIVIFSLDGSVVLGAEDTKPIPDAVRAEMIANGSGVLPETDARDNLTAYAVSPSAPGFDTRWLIVARQPTSVAFRAADSVVWTIVALGIVTGLVSIVGAGFIAGRVSRPFRDLADKASHIETGSSEMLPRVRGSVEAARLSSVLRALILRLNHAQKSSAAAEGRAVEEARRFTEDIAVLRNLAEVDTLTDMLNRRAFLEVAKDSMDHFRRHGRQFAVLMVDIDHFKRINDKLGHAAGDAAIRAVAKTIGRVLRPSDKGARFGGEEFVVLLREISRFEAVEAAERIRAAVADSPISSPGDDFFVTVSVGIAICDTLDRDMQSLIERADIALYAAKAKGRNCVAVAPQIAAEERRIA